MAYIGKTPVIGNFQKCDSIAVVNGQAAYTLQVGGTNVSPQSENHMLVSLNGILQAPVDSFTVSGSTLTFASNLVTGDVIDFVMILGNVLDLGVPSDNTVSLAKLTATGTKDATTFLRGDNTFAEVPAGGITEADQWRITTNITTPQSTVADLTTNWERVDTDGFGKIGTGLTESSGIFSFASTGVYYIHAFACFQGKDSNYYNLVLKTTTDNSTYDLASENYCFTQDDNDYSSISLTFMFNVTNITTHKVKFGHRMANTSGVGALQGQTNANGNAFTFIRLGDSV